MYRGRPAAPLRGRFQARTPRPRSGACLTASHRQGDHTPPMRHGGMTTSCVGSRRPSGAVLGLRASEAAAGACSAPGSGRQCRAVVSPPAGGSSTCECCPCYKACGAEQQVFVRMWRTSQCIPGSVLLLLPTGLLRHNAQLFRGWWGRSLALRYRRRRCALIPSLSPGLGSG